MTVRRRTDPPSGAARVSTLVLPPSWGRQNDSGATIDLNGSRPCRRGDGTRPGASRSALGFVSAVAVALVLLSTHPVRAGLLESVYHGIPSTAYGPTDASISTEQSYVAGMTPSYTFTNTNDGFQYSGSGQTNTFLGADASGAAATDTASNDYTAITAVGKVVITTAGTYTFDLASADDAARVYLGGSLVAENSYNGGLTVPTSATKTLAAGSYDFNLFYFEQGGGSGLNFTVTGPGTVAYSLPAPVPEPGSLALFGAGLLATIVVQGRKRGPVAPIGMK